MGIKPIQVDEKDLELARVHFGGRSLGDLGLTRRSLAVPQSWVVRKVVGRIVEQSPGEAVP